MIDNVLGRVGSGMFGGTITDGSDALIGDAGGLWIISSLVEFGRVSPSRIGGDVEGKGGGVRCKGGGRSRVVVDNGDVGGGGGGNFSNSIKFLKDIFVLGFTSGASTSFGGCVLAISFILGVYYYYTDVSISMYVCLG